MCTKFWSENLKGKDHMEDLGVCGRILECILKILFGRVWTAFIWLRIGMSGGHV